MRAGDIRRKGRVPSAPLRALCARICLGKFLTRKQNSNLVIVTDCASNFASRKITGVGNYLPRWPKLPARACGLFLDSFALHLWLRAICNEKPIADPRTRRMQRVAHSLLNQPPLSRSNFRGTDASKMANA
jgi:hypothetical protein